MTRRAFGLALRSSGLWRINAIQPDSRLHDMPRPDMCAHSDRVAIDHLDHIRNDWPGDAIYTLKVY